MRKANAIKRSLLKLLRQIYQVLDFCHDAPIAIADALDFCAPMIRVEPLFGQGLQLSFLDCAAFAGVNQSPAVVDPYAPIISETKPIKS